MLQPVHILIVLRAAEPNLYLDSIIYYLIHILLYELNLQSNL